MLKPWYNLDTALAKSLGKTLMHFAKNAHSYHPAYQYEEWTSLLYMHGATLHRYGSAKIMNKAWKRQGYWYASPEYRFAHEEDAARAEAKASMQWVVDNFEHLWD